MRGNPGWLASIALAAMIAIVIIARRTGPEAKASSRLWREVKSAKSAMRSEKKSMSDLEAYVQRLKAIDPSAAPMDVRRAFADYIKAIENDAEVRRNRHD